MDGKLSLVWVTFYLLGIFHSVHSAITGFGQKVPIPAGTKAFYHHQNHAGPGTYRFGYDTGSGPGQSFRQEERDENGRVRGRYGYVDAWGVLRVTEYMADETGYHVLSSGTKRPEPKYNGLFFQPKPILRPPTPFVGPLPPFLQKFPLNNL